MALTPTRRQLSWGGVAFALGMALALAMFAPAQGTIGPSESTRRAPDLMVRVVNDAGHPLEADLAITQWGRPVGNESLTIAPRDRTDAGFFLPEVDAYNIRVTWNVYVDGKAYPQKQDFLISTANCEGTDYVMFTIDSEPEPNRRGVVDDPDVTAQCGR